MNPNHYLAVAIAICSTHRPHWPTSAAVGKTLVSQQPDRSRRRGSSADACSRCRSASSGSRRACFDGSVCFGGEESAGASFLRRDGTVWTTDKDGLILALLAAEITARTGKDPGEHYRELTAQFGAPLLHAHRRTGDAASRRRVSQKLSPEAVTRRTLAGEPITAKLTRAPGNDAPIGGLKVVTDERLVRRPSLRHREHLQDLRGELSRRSAPRRDRRRGAAASSLRRCRLPPEGGSHKNSD